MQKIEEKDKTKQFLKEIIKQKFGECEKIEEVKNLKVDNKILDSSKLVEDLIILQQGNPDKTRLGFQPGMCSYQNDKDENKEVKTKKKSEDKRKSQNQKSNARRPRVQQPNAQRYPYFNGYCFKCNKFGHKTVNCRSIQCYNCMMFRHKASLCRNHVVNQNYNLVDTNKKSYNFHGYYYICNKYGHEASQCRYKSHLIRFERKIVSCFKCKHARHYANQCRSGNAVRYADNNGESKVQEIQFGERRVRTKKLILMYQNPMQAPLPLVIKFRVLGQCDFLSERKIFYPPHLNRSCC